MYAVTPLFLLWMESPDKAGSVLCVLWDLSGPRSRSSHQGVFRNEP